MNELTNQGITILKSGDKSEARRLLSLAVQQNSQDETAWLWLSGTVETDEERFRCLQQVLAINPANTAAKRGMEMLQAKAAGNPELDALLYGLKEPQKEAVLHLGTPLLIIAGPGSGKTEVIARRVAYLIIAKIAQPENILAVTFTNKAALSLKDRIQHKLLGVNVETMQVSTIHSFCAELLRRYSAQSTLPNGFRILDETSQFLLVYSNRKILGLNEIVKGRPKDFFDSVLRTFNLATEELVSPEKLAQWCQESGACGDEKVADLWKERQIIAQAYRGYCDLLGQKNLVDFASIQRLALVLVQNTLEVLIALRQRYPYILVDEYQDTNAVQERMFRLLAGNGNRLTVVGDDDQSVYRFRGATVRNIQEFPKQYPSTRIIKLVHNFRSYNPIVEHSQQVIVHNPARYPKELEAVRGLGSDVLLIYEHTAAEEAGAVARLIERLQKAGRIGSYNDVVILLRSVKSYAATYWEALSALGIPCQVIGDASLFQQDEISQLYDLFSFLGTTKEWGDKYVRHPLVGLSEATCLALKDHKGSLIEISGEEELSTIGITDLADRQRLHKLLELKRKALAQEHTSAMQVFYDLLAITGCLGRFELSNQATALVNLGIFSQLVAAWDEYGSTRNFYPFREYLELIKEGGVDPAQTTLENAVQIMTIHQAKGLEFPVVVVGAAMDGRLPSLHRKDPYEIPHELRASDGIEEGAIDPHFEDERKLFYVAATRARDLLIVGTADIVNKRGGGPSPFVYEMFGDDLRAAAEFSDEKIKEIESRRSGGQEPRPRYNYSQLGYYLQCPLRYKYTVVYGLVVPWQDPADYGANVHRCLEAIHQRAIRGEMIDPEELPNLVAESWFSTPRSQPEQEESLQKAAVHQLRQYLEAYGNRMSDVQQAETHFSSAVGQHIFTGKVDLIRQAVKSDLPGHRGVEIVDFKTSASGLEDSTQVELQLAIYALGVEASLGQPVACQTAHFLGDGQAVSWEWNEKRKTETQVQLSDLLGRIERQEFPPRQLYCSRCHEFKAVCPYARQ